ncbi:MAG: hypothetical protein ACPGTP_03500 [Bacteroidia bacterium]
MNRIINRGLFFFTCLIVLTSGKPKDLGDVVLNDLIQETQYHLDKGGQQEVRMVWWLPTEFWATIYAQNDDVSEEVADQIVEALDEYTMVIVLDGEVTTLGGLKSKSSKEIRGNTIVKNEEGRSFSPLKPGDIDGEAEMMLTILKPVFSNLLGKMGESMELMMFTDKGKSIINPYKEGGEIIYDRTNLDLGLPLSSLLEDKKCPEDDKVMNAKWDYCPYHGVKLD